MKTPRAMLYGSLSFGAVSVLAYSLWAFKWAPRGAATYVAVAAVYVGLGGLALSRLVQAPGAWKRFPLQFAAGFVIYAVGWCAFWFGLHGKYFADFWGAAAGLAGMTCFFQRALGSAGGFLRLFAMLLVCHSIGYYLGEVLCGPAHRTSGMLLWGAAHGLGFGAGLGYVLNHCQTPAKLPSSVSPL